MDPHATAAITLALILTVVTLGYAGLCVVKPFPRCRRCAGTGKTTTRVLRRTRTCRPCRGTGHRLRTGRAVYNHFRRLRTEATR